MSLELRAGDRVLRLGERPLLMGVVNTSPDSFSDGGRWPTLEAQFDRARELVDAGAAIVDVGGESGVTNRPAVAPEEEIERVVPLIERVADALDVVVSVDTYKPSVAEAAIRAGAGMVNDISGLLSVEVADVCADSGAALVIVHTRAAPKEKLLDPYWDGRVVEDAHAFLRERMDRDAGTLAALGHGLDAGAHIFRVHDVAGAADFVAVRAVLRGEADVASDARLADELRRELP